MDAFEAVLRAQMEPLQYAAFFGALAVLGGLELVARRSREATARGRRWLANGGLTVLNILILGAVPVGGIVAADYARAEGIGLLNLLPMPALAAFVAGIVLRSLVSWAVHLAMHKVPVLWRIHRVHHTDTGFDVTTTVRFHPLEFVISMPLAVGAAVALGIPPVALMAYEVFDAAMAVITHADVRLPARLDRALRTVLVTPDMHRLHHSAHRKETDSNYGATFSFWDRLFGTYRETPAEALASMPLGLAECRDRRAASLGWLLALPFLDLRGSIAATGQETAR